MQNIFDSRFANTDLEDVQHFINIPKGVKVMIGYDNLVHGEAVPGYGEDGVVRSDIERLHGAVELVGAWA